MAKQTWIVMLFMAFVVFERLYERRFSRQAARGQVKMRWSYIALHVLHVAIYLGAPIEHFLANRQANWLCISLGLVLFAVATVVRLIAIRTLGRFWSLHLEIRPDHQLVRVGIYQYMRHPAYTAIMLEMLAIPLVANAYATLVASALIYIPVLLLRWRREETEMIEKFGDQYVGYRKEVPAFFPWPTRKHEPPAEMGRSS